MRYVRLGKTGLSVSKTSLGTVPLQRMSPEDSTRLLRRAFDAGVNFYDTADSYPVAEERLALAFSGVRDRVIYATKISPRDYKTACEHIKRSLKRLGTDYIDLIQFHNPPELPCPDDEDGAFRAALEAKARGQVRHIGFTSHSCALAMRAASSGLFETIEYPLNHLIAERDEEFLRLCAEHDIGVIGMKPFAGGMLKTPLLTFAFFGAHKNVVPIYGVQRMSELEALLELEESPPPMDAYMRKLIQRDRAALSGYFCRGCGACSKVCPEGINVSSCNRMGDFLTRNMPGVYLTPRWKAEMEKTLSCRKCGACVAACPYGLDVRELMDDSREIFMDTRERCGDMSASIK